MTRGQIEARARVQRVLIWTGPVMLVGWTASWVFLARFIPPPSPERSPEHVVAALSNHTNELKLGLLITMFASALLVPFCAVISSHIRRSEGYGGGALASTQITSAAVLSLEFIILAVGIMPAALVLFFRHGPFAWNGVIGFFTPLTSFAIWMFAMFYALRCAIADELTDATALA